MTYTLSFWRARGHSTLLLGLTAAALAILLANVASQSETSAPATSASPSVSAELQRALTAAGQPPAAIEATRVRIPTYAHSGITIAADGGQRVTIGLPAVGKGREVGNTTLYDGRGQASLIAVQPTDSGVRALIRLAGPAAAERYRFAVAGTGRLQRRPDGTVAILDRGHRELGVIAAPWARDANGRAVATRYEIQGTTLVQVVDHRRRGVAYPVVADPSFIDVLRCGGSIIAAAVGVGIPLAKLVQVAKFVKAVGGVREAAKLLIGATSRAEKLKVLRRAVGAKSASAVAAAMLGIPAVRDNCF